MKRRKDATFTIPPTDRERLSRALADTPAIMLKWFLQYQGLPQYLGASKETITDRFLQHIEREEMTLEAAYDAVREFYEFGAKEVRLYDVEPNALTHIPHELRGSRITTLADARVRRQPATTATNYSYLKGERLRFSFSERHEDLVLDPIQEEVIRKPRTNVIVFDGHSEGGQAYIALDPPRRRHPHGVSTLSFYEYHLGRVQEFIGAELVPVDLRSCIARLEASELADLTRSEGKSDRCRIRFVANTGPDVRQDELYDAFVGQRRTADAATLVWRAEESMDSLGQPRLQRPVKTRIEVRTSAVHFVQGTLEHEADYVMEMIRTNA